MKRFVLVVLASALAGALGVAGVAAQSGTSLGTVHVTKKVMADGKPLPAGTYQVRLTTEEPKPAVGQTPSAERWVEFVKGGKVAGREVATIVPADEMGAIAKGKKPKANASSVELLKGGDYLRVWINRGGTNYIINLPTA